MEPHATPRWLIVGAAALATMAGTVLAINGGHGTPGQPTAALLDATQQTVSATVTAAQLNVRAVPTGSTSVDLDPSSVIGHLTNGAQVQVSCQFTGTSAGAAGDTWYRITGATVPAAPAGSDAVASAAYLSVADVGSIPACDASSGNPAAVVNQPANQPANQPVSDGQGGCTTVTDNEFLNVPIGVCIDRRGTKDQVFSDIYVNDEASDATASGCRIDVKLLDEHNVNHGENAVPCGKGHYPGPSLTTTAPTSLRASAEVTIDVGKTYPVTDSPRVVVGGDATYVTLGDSYSAGEGTFAYTPSTQEGTKADNCHRSDTDSYAARFAAEDDVPPEYKNSMVILACSGGVIPDVDGDVHVTGDTVLGDDTKRAERATPPEAVQLDSAGLGPDTKLVTLTIGGNDLGFATVLTNCVNNRPSPDPALRGVVGCKAKWQQKVAATIQALGPALAQTYRDVTKAAPNAHVVVLTYPYLLPTDRAGLGQLDKGLLCLPAQNLSDDDLRWIHDVTDQFDQTIIDQATAAGAIPIDMRPALAGHEMCTPQSEINGLGVASDQPNGIYQEIYHPTASGYQAEADTLDKKLHELNLL